MGPAIKKIDVIIHQEGVKQTAAKTNATHIT